MAYVRANTQTSNGWRPGSVRLGALLHPAAHLPDWKVAAARLDQAARRRRSRAAVHQAARGRLAAFNDALVRRDRTALAGMLGSLDPNSKIVSGGQYFFHMGCGGIFIGCPQNMNDVNQSLAGDSNFSNVQASPESTGFVVSCTYSGAGGGYSSVQSVGMEMAQVISSNLSGLQSISFLSADGPTGTPAAPGTTAYTPGGDGSSPQGFSLTQLLASMGLSGAAGAAIGIVGLILIAKVL